MQVRACWMKGAMCIVLGFLLWKLYLEGTQLIIIGLQKRFALYNHYHVAGNMFKWAKKKLISSLSFYPLCSCILVLIKRKNFQVNLIEWLKKKVSDRNPEGVLDPKLPEKPTSRALKRALLVALRCVDPNAQKRPKMGHVVHMLEADESPFREVCV